MPAGLHTLSSDVKSILWGYVDYTSLTGDTADIVSGAHDNGYTSTLTYLQNEGLLDKIILLRGYKDLAYEIKGLELPHLDIQGLFMTKRLQTHSSKKNNVPNQAAPPTPQHDTDKTRGKAPTPPSRNSASPVKKSKQVEPDQVCSNTCSF